ncbi:hypothetical protein A0H81_01838 [Grifola frondosa]|uniref:Uncharacterized protein n=1 Tax=Grifola frondosa TaxID=5627 RepID=A0A1C7MJZ9_GRIFR|nr:hypothetical protein A0H81_01838 [Grifola frondosa]
MVDLPTADKEQSAAFIRDERVLIVCHPASVSGSVSGHSLQQVNARLSQSQLALHACHARDTGTRTPHGVLLGMGGGVLG